MVKKRIKKEINSRKHYSKLMPWSCKEDTVTAWTSLIGIMLFKLWDSVLSSVIFFLKYPHMTTKTIVPAMTIK